MRNPMPINYDDNHPTKIALGSKINCPNCKEPIESTESYIMLSLGRLRYCKDCKILFRRSKQKPTRSPKIVIEDLSRDELEYLERKPRKRKRK